MSGNLHWEGWSQNLRLKVFNNFNSLINTHFVGITTGQSGQPDVITVLQLQCQCSRSPQGAESNGIAYMCEISHPFCDFLIKVLAPVSSYASGSSSQSSALENYQLFILCDLLALITPFGKSNICLDQPPLLQLGWMYSAKPRWASF